MARGLFLKSLFSNHATNLLKLQFSRAISKSKALIHEKMNDNFYKTSLASSTSKNHQITQFCYTIKTRGREERERERDGSRTFALVL